MVPTAAAAPIAIGNVRLVDLPEAVGVITMPAGLTMLPTSNAEVLTVQDVFSFILTTLGFVIDNAHPFEKEMTALDAVLTIT
jgi:hypothetical protein